MSPNTLSRGENLERLRAGTTWDVVVVGGGATGLGAAVDAAARGYKTLVLESLDFAHGTSSRSTKLVHGGVRYLAQGNIPLVREALHERGLLTRNAPHLVHPRDFIVPAYRYWQIPFYGVGLWLYDRLAGRLSLGRSRWLSRKDVLKRTPTIRGEGLRGGILYIDGQFDDARLAVALARTAVGLGASALNHVAVIGLVKELGRIVGVRARDAETGEEFAIRAKAVVNATGVYADAVRRLDQPDASALLAPSQGAHIVLDRSFLPGDTAIMIPKTDDGRVLFAIPWHHRTLIGTTDVPLSQTPREPGPLAEELAFLLEHAGRHLTRTPTAADVKSQFAGLRPLINSEVGRGGQTKKLSREHAVVVSDSGLITVTGGKWTTYRVMACDAVDHAAEVGALARKPCATENLHLHGWTDHLADREETLAIYGSELADLKELIARSPEAGRKLHAALPYVEVEVIWGVRHEAARTIEDVLARRTRALFLDARACIEVAPRVAEIMAAELGEDQAWQDRQVADFRALAATYLPPAGDAIPTRPTRGHPS
ncbi:glycerol-3-phosphate dehydrogenase/oxidase [Paludisphaera mucosa]|uniref:Glycerol-3-phosphate dehydrogenase/oxidase n=1 Tax=Paludisphaera mucosa TaxID=3030827 RepID=A0ABT6F904_9BACT|nr:glycerol-3-phosphate dehydrogenase/oxidase [Paludisphaera mucosa]MDG3004007.1 glycerol-3-phosphate dehydrogenase/oxidase [Paludisphaera mucosa]